MNYAFTVHQKSAIDAGITNGNQLLVLEMIAIAPQWADVVCLDAEADDCYFFTARQMVANELQLWGLKPDTVYRHFRSLVQLELIDFVKDGKRDLTRLTEKGKHFFSSKQAKNTMSEIDPNRYVGNRSELAENSEIDPSKVGNESEKCSEIDPTYPNTRTYPVTKGKEDPSLNSVNNETNEPERQENQPDPAILAGNCRKHRGFCSCRQCKSDVSDLLYNLENSWLEYFQPCLQNTLLEKWHEYDTQYLTYEQIVKQIWDHIGTGRHEKISKLKDRPFFSQPIEMAIRELNRKASGRAA